MSKLLMARDVPFFLTVLLGLFGWTITRTVDSLAESPVVEYRESVDGENVMMAFTNVSRDQRVANVTLSVHALEQSSFDTASVAVVFARTTNIDIKPSVALRSITLHKVTLQPGNRVEISARLSGTGGVTARARSATSTIRLIPRSVETRLIEYEFWVLLAALMVWAILIIFYMRSDYARRAKDENGPRKIQVLVGFDQRLGNISISIVPDCGSRDIDDESEGDGGEE